MSHPVTPLRDLSETEFPAPAAPGPELVPPVETGVKPLPAAGESSARTPRLVSTAGTVGGAVGRVVDIARHLPQRVNDMKQRYTSRTSGPAQVGMSDRVAHARNRADYYAQNYPLQTLGAVFGAAFIAGFSIHIWRSRG